MPGNWAAMSLAPDEAEQLPRLERFRDEHPEVIILLKGPMSKAYLGLRKVQRSTLRDLFDDLEEMFRPGVRGG